MDGQNAEQIADAAVRAKAKRHEIELAARDLAAERHAKRKAAKFTGFEDLSSIDTTPVPPSIVKVEGLGTNKNSALVVPGQVVVLSGHRKGGKTWTAAVAEAQHMLGNREHHVVHVDYERQRKSAARRLQMLGVPVWMIKSQYHYATMAPPAEAIAELGSGVLVVIDSWRGLQRQAAPGSSGNDGDAVEDVYATLLNPYVEAGATVIILDHLTKEGKNGTFGSERKESAADLVIQVEKVKAFSKQDSGFAKLTVTADREGNFTDGDVPAYLWMPADGDAVEYETAVSPDCHNYYPSESEAAHEAKHRKPVDDYPARPELRAWAPEGRKGTVADVIDAAKLTVQGKRENAATELIARMPLKLSANEAAKELAASPALKSDPDTKLSPDTWRKKVLNPMVLARKLVREEGRDGKLDIPENALLSQLNGTDSD